MWGASQSLDKENPTDYNAWLALNHVTLIYGFLPVIMFCKVANIWTRLYLKPAFLCNDQIAVSLRSSFFKILFFFVLTCPMSFFFRKRKTGCT